MNRFISTFIRRRITTAMIFAAVTLVGVIAVTRLPVELLPDIELPKLTVITPFENASPSEVEKLVTVRIEEAVTAVSGVTGISSESIEGMSIVKISFRWGTDMDMALIEAKEKADLIRGELPENTGKSVVVKYDPSDEPVMIYSVTVKGCEPGDVRRRVEKEIVPFLERIKGVALVDVLGGMKREIRIDVDNGSLYSYSLSLDEVAERVNMANYSYPAGNIVKGEKEFQVRTTGEFLTLSDIRSVVAGYNSSGVPVYLGSIAEVKDTFKDRKSVIRFNGEDGVALLIRKEPGKNTIDTCESIKSVTAELSQKSGGGFIFSAVYDQSLFIKNAINNVLMNAVLGGLISFFILLFFLKSPGPPLIIATAIPASMLGTFILMEIYGITVNTMSLGGLAIGTGITVDAGIVVLESISITGTENDKLNLSEAALKGTAAVALPVVASALTTIVVFLPIVFLDGLAGAVFRDLAASVSFSILISMISSLTLVPMLASIDPGSLKWSFFYRGKLSGTVSGLGNLSDRTMSSIIRLYERAIKAALLKRGAVISAGALSMAAGILLFLVIEKEVMPSVDPGEFSIEIEMPGGSPLSATSDFCAGIERVLMATEGVGSVFTKAGCDPDDNISEKISGRGSESGVIRVFVRRGAGRSSREIIDELRGTVSGGEKIKLSYKLKEDLVGSFFGSDGDTLTVELYGSDTSELRERGAKLKEVLSASGIFSKTGAVLDSESPELLVNIDRERASSLGLSAENISSAISMAVRGGSSTRFRDRDDEVDVTLRLAERDRSDAVSVGRIMLKTGSGAVVPVSGVARITEGSGNVKIIRKEQSKLNIVSAEFIPGSESAADDVKKNVRNFLTSSGWEFRFADGRGDAGEALNAMFFAALLSIIFIYMLLAGQFQSLRDPLIIMLSIPVTLLGVSLSLLITGQSLNINSGIGIIMLCGTVVNNGIVLFDFIDNERRKGASVDAAIIDAGKKRLAPIMMNALTTVFAVLPIASGIGEGSEIQRPLAITIIGGTTFSTVLTLVLIPVIYAVLEKKAARI